MDAASIGRVSPEAGVLSQQMSLRESVAPGQHGGRSGTAAAPLFFAKLLCSFFRLSRLDFPK
jgi:hypothetical protein